MMKAKSREMDGEIVTEDEAALYDRQIRLWGLPAQKRLRASRVLVAGLKGLGAEVSKNIVLAGIKSLTILDHTQVDNEDCFSQFFTNKSDIGSNRATCSLPKIQQLNPTVEVIADTSDVKDKEESFFLQFDIVCLTNCPASTAIAVNEICRKNEIKFMLGNVHGMFGYFFNDFGKHEFQTQTMPSLNENLKDPPAKRAKIEGILETNSISYVSLKQALSSEFVLPTSKKRRSKLTNSFAILKALNEFHNTYGRNPSIITMESDSKLLNEILVSYLKSNFDERLGRVCISEISPVCAIVGGVFAQEIIKALSRTDATFENFFFFNSLIGTGVVESYGMENYDKGEVVEVDVESLPFACLPTDVIHMKVKSGSKISNILGYAISHFKSEKCRSIVFSGVGNAITKSITCVEIMKRKFKDVHQENKIMYRTVEEFWEPKTADLDRLKVTREIPTIYSLLTKDMIEKSPKTNEMTVQKSSTKLEIKGVPEGDSTVEAAFSRRPNKRKKFNSKPNN